MIGTNLTFATLLSSQQPMKVVRHTQRTILRGIIPGRGLTLRPQSLEKSFQRRLHSFNAYQRDSDSRYYPRNWFLGRDVAEKI
jgi:hypothetical protein